MKKIHFFVLTLCINGSVAAQNVGIGTTMPAEKLEVMGKTKTQTFQMTNGAANDYFLKSDANGNATWVAASSIPDRGGIIPFSTGIILSGPTVVSAQPILMGFGNHTTEVIDGSGQSTSPAEAGGFAFTVPFTGTIKNLQISADLLVASIAFINIIPLVYEFTVHISPSNPNDGFSHVSSQYVTTPFTSTLTFGGSGFLLPGTFYSASNLNTGSLAVNAGDRIGIRIRTLPSSDPSASDITQLSFNASLMYSY